MEGIRIFQCLFCKDEFNLLTNLQDHYSIHTEENQYICNSCGCEFTNSKQLADHRTQTHQVAGNGPFSCPLCKTKLKTSNSLVSHIRSHTGEKSFKCEVCNKWLGSPTALHSHHKIHKTDWDFKENI